MVEVMPFRGTVAVSGSELQIMVSKIKLYEDTLEKIADPRKRDHKEPDTYTQLGCVMHMAQEALDAGKRIEHNVYNPPNTDEVRTEAGLQGEMRERGVCE